MVCQFNWSFQRANFLFLWYSPSFFCYLFSLFPLQYLFFPSIWFLFGSLLFFKNFLRWKIRLLIQTVTSSIQTFTTVNFSQNIGFILYVLLFHVSFSLMLFSNFPYDFFSFTYSYLGVCCLISTYLRLYQIFFYIVDFYFYYTVVREHSLYVLSYFKCTEACFMTWHRVNLGEC